jgi:OTU domain-containing protein 6
MLIVKARKTAALAEQQAPIDTDADAKLEREAKEEERAINKLCNDLALEMHEVPNSYFTLQLIIIAYSRFSLIRSTQTATVSSLQSQTNSRSSTSSHRTKRTTSSRA